MRLILAFALLLAVPVYAGTPYADGKYDEAIKAGLAENNAAGFAAAARASLTEELSRDTPCLECLERTEGFARRAIAAGPKLPDGHIYLAITLGLKEHIEGIVVAKLNGYPDEAKRALDAALLADPDNAWALGSLGGWNFEIVNHAGAGLAGLIYGATIRQGRDAFAAAFKASPDNIMLWYQYALALAQVDAVRFHGEIESALTKTVRGTDDTVFARLMQKRAAALLELLKKGDAAAFAARVKKYQGYP